MNSFSSFMFLSFIKMVHFNSLSFYLFLHLLHHFLFILTNSTLSNLTQNILQRRTLILNQLNSQLEKRAKLWPSDSEENILTSDFEIHTQWKNSTDNDAIRHSEIAEALKFNSNPTSNENGDEEGEDDEEMSSNTATVAEVPRCAIDGRFYCNHQEDYPTEIVSRIIKYYRYPLKSMFKQLKNQVMPTLAEDNTSGLVCESQTRLLRVGWATNTDGRWLVVLNTDQYQQYVTEVVCRKTSDSCNFVPPCYKAKCLQRFNTQKLLVIDPVVPHRGPFLSEFLFPSCCVCHIPSSTLKLN